MRRDGIAPFMLSIVAGGLLACDSSRQVDVEMTLQRGRCASAECGEVVRGTGVLFTSAGREFGSEAGEPILYSEGVTEAGTTILLEVAFRGSIVDEVRFREVERSRVVYRGRILRHSFRPTADGWSFALDTVDARDPGPDGPLPISVRNGSIVRRDPLDAEQVAQDHADTDLEGGCGGSVVDTFVVLPDPEDSRFDDPGFEDSDVEDPSPSDPPEDVEDPPPSTGEPPPPDDTYDDPPPRDDFDPDSGGCSGDTADDDSGGCGADPDDEGGGCSEDDAPDDDEGGGCSGDDTPDDDEGGGCSGDDGPDDADGGCGGDDGDGGCSGSDGSASAVFTARAVRGTFRLAWPVGLVAWVNRRMRRRCGLREGIAGGTNDA